MAALIFPALDLAVAALAPDDAAAAALAPDDATSADPVDEHLPGGDPADADAPPRAVHQYGDHGDALVRLVAEGSLDLAVIGIADQVPLPGQVTATPIGGDALAMLTPPTWRPAGRRRLFSGVVPYHCLDLSGALIQQRISDLGGVPRLCATAEVAVITSRVLRAPALVARSIASLYARPDETLAAAPFPLAFHLQAVTRTPPPAYLPRLVETLARAAELTPASP